MWCGVVWCGVVWCGVVCDLTFYLFTSLPHKEPNLHAIHKSCPPWSINRATLLGWIAAPDTVYPKDPRMWGVYLDVKSNEKQTFELLHSSGSEVKMMCLPSNGLCGAYHPFMCCLCVCVCVCVCPHARHTELHQLCIAMHVYQHLDLDCLLNISM